MLNFGFLTPKRRGTTSFDVFFVKIGPAAWTVAVWKNPWKRSQHFWCAISRIRGKGIPWGIVTKFCMWTDIHDLMTYATFGDDHLRGLGVAISRISHFPIDLRRRPYNILALRCECAVFSCSWCHYCISFVCFPVVMCCTMIAISR